MRHVALAAALAVGMLMHHPHAAHAAAPAATPPVGDTGPVDWGNGKPPAKPTVAQAKAHALRVLGPAQYRCLHALAQRESGWRTTAYNRHSGAYGIPQAVPGSKMASAGKDWRTNPITQVRWMIGYVNGRYGSACNAYQHALVVGWY